MNSVFVAGTDTGVGKTYVAAGLAGVLRGRGINVGIMKPYSAGESTGGISGDAGILARAAGAPVDHSMNPMHQDAAAPPYCSLAGTGHDPRRIVRAYHRLARSRDVMVVEGMGGVMVPILSDYYMADLARDMGLPVLVVATNQMGSANHTIMTVESCRSRRVRVLGVVLNMIHDGYGEDTLGVILRDTVGVPVLGVVPRNGAAFGDYLDVDSVLGR